MSAPPADAPSLDANGLLELLDTMAPVTPGIATYCSSGDWAVGCQMALHPGRSFIVAQHEGHAFVGAMDAQPGQRGRLHSPESDWGFASPILGPDVRRGADLAAAALAATESQWSLAILSGLSTAHADALELAVRGRFRSVGRRAGVTCAIASLDGGSEGFLERRSAKMRTNLRRDARRLQDAGITVEVVPGDSDPNQIMARAAAIASRSWKAETVPNMLSTPPYGAFYRAVLGRAAAAGRLRAAFARRDDGLDEGFVFGAVLGGSYRGFQLGFSEDVATLGVGNQVQVALIEHLAREGIAEYDLGMSMDYKTRWAEQTLPLHILVIHR